MDSRGKDTHNLPVCCIHNYHCSVYSPRLHFSTPRCGKCCSCCSCCLSWCPFSNSREIPCCGSRSQCANLGLSCRNEPWPSCRNNQCWIHCKFQSQQDLSSSMPSPNQGHTIP